MPSDVSPKPELVALLSAAGISEREHAGSDIGALQKIAGSSLIDWQMAILRKCGVLTFLIEVDSVTGELLSLADRFNDDGMRVEFIRSAKDMQSFLTPATQLVIQAEAHYFSAPLVAELMQQTPPFVATVDGRDENAVFERIDLNTMWAGFAVLDAATARSLMELPDGWSISSSLLRHAVQRGVSFLPFNQGELQNGDIARISNDADADALAQHMLTARTSQASGLIESRVFGPSARWLAPYIWSARSGAAVLQTSEFAVALASLGCGAVGWTIAASSTALFAIFLHMLSGVTGSFGDTVRNRSQTLFFWIILSASALTLAWSSPDFGPDAITFVAVSIGLIIAALKIELPRWCSALLQSPALFAAGMLISAGFSVYATGAKMIALTQVSLLVAGLYLPKSRVKNRYQA